MSKNKKKQPAGPPPGPSSRYRFFLWMTSFLALAGLLVGIDYATIWPDAEAYFIWKSITNAGHTNILQDILSTIPSESEYWLLAYRLPGLLLYALGIYLFFRWGRSLFGTETVQVTLLLVAASLLLQFLAKVASLDAARFGLELGFWVALMHYFKKPEREWLVPTAILGVAAILVGQTATLIVVLSWWMGYFLLLKKAEGSRPQVALPFLFIIGVFAVDFLVSVLNPAHSSMMLASYFHPFKLSFLKLLFFTFLGLAPFIGFAFAAIRDLIYKWRKGEELAMLVGVGMIGAFLGQSLVFPFLLTFLTAKQVINYFKIENYPWQNWVKGGQVLHLLVFFMVAVLLLVGGTFNFQADGFRALVGICFAYWMFSFVGVIGVYGFRRDYVLGGITIAGALAVLFFWVQVYPFMHLQRNWPERVVKEIMEEDKSNEGILLGNCLEVRDGNETKDQLNPVALQIVPYLERQSISYEGCKGITDMITDQRYINISSETPDSTITYSIEEEGWSWPLREVHITTK